MKEQIGALAQTIRDASDARTLPELDAEAILVRVQHVPHTTHMAGCSIGSVKGGGEFPAAVYGDSYIYVTLAQAASYVTSPLSGLKEIAVVPEPLMELTCLTDGSVADRSLDATLTTLAGEELQAVIEASDYRILKARATGTSSSAATLLSGLIRPGAADAGNIAIQLRSTAELGMALRMLRSGTPPTHLLFEGTLSLPLVTRNRVSLFYEHLKRLCCVEARHRGVALLAVSKAQGMPQVELLEDLMREKRRGGEQQSNEHWYLRVDSADDNDLGSDIWKGQRIPPAGAVTYLLRLHRSTSPLRVDMDRRFWEDRIRGTTEHEMQAHESALFEILDYASHDQRAYGYPYPLAAVRTRVAMTRTQRAGLREQVVEGLVAAGMKRSLFRDVTAAHAAE